MTILAFLLHLLLDFLLGAGILSLLKKDRLPFGHFFIALLIGVVAETMVTFMAMWAGAGLYLAFGLSVLLALMLNVNTFINVFKNPSEFLSKTKGSFSDFSKFSIYDSLFLLLIVQKAGVILWQLFRTPTIHSDALKHWSTQGRLIYSQINFSATHGTKNFLGKQVKVVMDYPLELPIWRANSAILNNGWNEFVSRSDGLLFFIVICGIVGSVMWMLTQKRWIALGAAFIVASLPLQVWHGASGYADIGVEAFLVGAIACFIGKEFLLCGILAAGAIWCKNDGLVLYLAGIVTAVLSFHFLKKEISISKSIKEVGYFFAGLAAVLPWLIFQSLYSYSVFKKLNEPIKDMSGSPGSSAKKLKKVLEKKNLDPSESSLDLLWEHVFTGSTSGIFWIIIFLGFLILSKRLLSDQIGRGLVLFFITSSAIIYYVFTFTPAYEYLLTQTTIHRVLLQFSAAALLVLGYGVSLEMKMKKGN